MASTLTSTGLGSGLDVNGLVAKLVAAERGPADARWSKEDKALAADVSAVGKLRGALAALNTSATALKDASALLTKSVYSSDYGILTPVVDSTAVPASYDIDVSQLAAASRFTSIAVGSDYSTDVEQGTLTIQQGASTINVVVNSGNNTLGGLRDAINAAAGNTGVTATLITSSTGVRLQVNGGATGDSNSLSFSSSNASGSGTVRLADLFADRSTSATYTDATQNLQAGSITISQAGYASFSVSLSGGNRSLQDFVDAVNSSVSNPGVRARIVSVNSGGVQVVLSGVPGSGGTPIAMSQAPSGGASYDVSLSAFVSGQTSQSARKSVATDAIVKVDGLTLTSSGNTFKDAIQGVTLNVAKVTEAGKAAKLTVSNNDAAVKGKVADFVAAYNQLSTTFSALGGYEAKNKIAGPMLGDGMLLAIQSQMRRTLGNSNTSSLTAYSTLASLGVVSGADGLLVIDDAKLSAALKVDFRSVSSVFSGSTGLAASFATKLDTHLSTSGDITARESVLALQRKDLDKRKVALDARMVDFQVRQLKIFNSLDGMLSKMQTTSSALSQSLAKAASG